MDLFVDPSRGGCGPHPPDSDSEGSSQHGSGDAGPFFGQEGLSVCSATGEGGARESDSIYLFLLKIFENEPLTNLDFAFLSPDALAYLREVLRRKFVLGPNFEGLELIKGRRRNEEQFKFVVKKGMKRLFRNFKRSRKGFIKGDKLLDELEFYRHYFWDASGHDRAQFDAFFLPGSKIQKEFAAGAARLDKTVSFSYLARVFRSEPFKRDFVAYLLHDFGQEYVQTRAHKLLKVAANFEAGKRPKSNKLPWTRAEMVEAQKCFVNLIYSLT